MSESGDERMPALVRLDDAARSAAWVWEPATRTVASPELGASFVFSVCFTQVALSYGGHSWVWHREPGPVRDTIGSIYNSALASL